MAIELRVRALRVIAVALVVGVLAFAGVAVALWVLKVAPVQPNAEPPIVSYVAAGMLLLMAALSLFVPNLVASNAARQSPPANLDRLTALLNIHQGKEIIGLAMLESAAFFSLVAFILEGRPWTPALTAAALGLMMIRFPTTGKIENWIDSQRSLFE